MHIQLNIFWCSQRNKYLRYGLEAVHFTQILIFFLSDFERKYPLSLTLKYPVHINELNAIIGSIKHPLSITNEMKKFNVPVIFIR